MARRVLMAEVSGRLVLGRPLLLCNSVNSRCMLRRIGRIGEPWLMNLDAAMFSGPVFLRFYGLSPGM